MTIDLNCFVVDLNKTLHLNVELVEGEDGPKVEVWQVEVVVQQLQQAVAALAPHTVLQGEAHAAHDGEATAAVEQDVAQVEVPLHQARLVAQTTGMNVPVAPPPTSSERVR